jgi:hypothetical protein
VKDDTTYGLAPERLARLLAFGLQGAGANGAPDASRSPAEDLKDMLTCPLPLDPGLPNSLPAVLRWTSDEVLAAAGRSMGNLLLDSATSLSVIRTLKDYAKKLVHRGASEAKQAAALVVYYASIANALVFHRQKITQHSYRALDEAYGELEQKPSVPPELKDLFEKAQAICRQRKKVTG